MDVLMPQLGETVAEGKISAWFKSVGDHVAAGDNLFEVETDKTAMEVPTTRGGIVTEIRVGAGETVPVGTVVAVIADGDGAVIAKAPSPQKANASPTSPAPRAPIAPVAPVASTSMPRASAPTVSAPAAPIARTGAFDPFNEVRFPDRGYGPARLPSGIPITPLARRLAAEAGVDVSALKGSGPEGRVVARDLDDARAPSTSVSSLLAKGPVSGPAQFDVVPHDVARRQEALALAAAKHTVPHFVVHRDVTIDTLLRLIEEINAVDTSFRVALVHCVTKALAIALTKVPDANVQWSDDHMLRFRQADISVVAGGGHATTIRAADRKGLAAIALDHREGRRSESEGVATVWDMSTAGVNAIDAIVRPPHTTALTIGAVAKHAIVASGIDGDRLAIATRLTLTLSCDHRAIDGAVGARLIGACAAALERPLALIL